jgi:hypothetical protein
MQNALFNVVSESVTSNDYYTPKWLFDVWELQFDIDVCAPAQAFRGYRLNVGLVKPMMV